MSAINWFEIPVTDMERAARFYEALEGRSLKRETFMGVPHAIFQSAKEGGVGGALIYEEKRKPSSEGTTVYLDSSDIDAALERVSKLGAEVLVPKTSIGPIGFMALLIDSEGNKIGLHTRPA
jgi:predicted enzyme related to lactoylglutathione lyase